MCGYKSCERIYDTIKYIICIILILITFLFEDNYIDYMYYIVPFGMELILFVLFMRGKENRPTPCICCQLYCWRPFVEIFYKIACNKFKPRNPNDTAVAGPEWIDLSPKTKIQTT